jgi:cytidylate kinase
MVEPGHDALRVFVTASPETRVARLADRNDLDPERAARAVKQSDAARRDYLRLCDVEEELPTHYDVIVKKDLLSIEQGARLVTEAGSASDSLRGELA